MTDPDAVSRSPSSMGIGFNGWDFVDAYKVSIDPNPDLATNAIDNSDPPVAKRPKNRQGRDRLGENPLVKLVSNKGRSGCQQARTGTGEEAPGYCR
jgi:hypothetical protein